MDDNIIVMYYKKYKFVSHLMAMLRFMDDNMDDNIIVMYYKIYKFVSHLMAMLRFMDDNMDNNMDDNIIVMYSGRQRKCRKNKKTRISPAPEVIAP